ncbi:MAG: hypothetical protein LBL19_04275 [Spirochaetaceae bacterium]|jgi:hypothetical protein|nr:hypothetical protein [Spirochaetaceae bacterium]
MKIPGAIFRDRGVVIDLSRKPAKSFFLVIGLLCLVPFGGNAQTTSANAGVEVAIMPFMGVDDAELILQLHDTVVSRVDALDNYLILQVSAAEHPQILTLSPDSPPGSEYLGSSLYVLTGEFYLDIDDLQHFQLWLWNSASGRLVYTDEMVTENYEEAEAYLPPLVSWIFSQIPQNDIPVLAASQPEILPNPELIPQTEIGSEVEALSEGAEGTEKNNLFMGRLYLGFRGGPIFNSYSVFQTSTGYKSGLVQSFSYEAALLADFRIFRFLSIQGEAVFTMDAFATTRTTQNVSFIDKVTSLSLLFPLIIKVPLDFGPFILALHSGIYFAMPLGKMALKSDIGAGDYTVKLNPPLGFMVGTDLSFPLGPGMFLLDMRYGRDFGISTAQNASRLSYTRDRIAVSLGYKFFIWSR